MESMVGREENKIELLKVSREKIRVLGGLIESEQQNGWKRWEA